MSLIETILKQGGITLTRELKEFSPTEGFFVALDKEHEDFIGIKNTNKVEKKLKKYSKLAAQFNCYVGVWVSERDQRIYFDLSEHIESLSDALYKGAQRKQKAIYDCKNKEEVFV